MTTTNYANYVLMDLASYFKANRVVVASIHSQSYVDYEAYDKVFSIMYEYCEDTFSISQIVKNIPISILQKEQEFYKNDILVVNKHSSLLDVCTAHLDKIGTEVIVNYLIRFNKLIVGILSLQYTKAKHIKTYSDLSLEDITKLKAASDFFSIVI